jgi:hypothetical protein
VRSLQDALGGLVAHSNFQWSIALAALYAAVACGVFARSTRRPALVLAGVLAAVAWVAEGFGGIFTGTATDPNTGPLLVLLAATLWPLGRPGHPRLHRGTSSLTFRRRFSFGAPAYTPTSILTSAHRAAEERSGDPDCGGRATWPREKRNRARATPRGSP